MKLHTKDRTIERSGDFSESNFTIAANTHAFEVLSSRLYTDPILAVVRELSTNAYDAQVEAGTTDKPFDVHMPNSFASFFKVRDYGTGLSPEDVKHVYTTYFESTRSDSDDFIGRLGLGSKSPFALTDQFMVTSYWNGTSYTYSAYRNETGEPRIALMDTNATDEPNGLEITVQVKAGDEYEWQRAAQKVYRFMPMCPKITGANVEFEECEPLFEHAHYKLYSNRQEAGVPSRINVVMGNVRYTVATEHFKIKLGQSGALILFVNNGECDFAVSREELHYNERTIANIQSHLDKVSKDVQVKIDAQLTGDISVMAEIRNRQRFSNVWDLPAGKKSISIKESGKYELKCMKLKGNKLCIGQDRWRESLQPSEYTDYVIVHCDVKMTQAYKNRLRYWLSSQEGIMYLADVEDEVRFTQVFGEPSIRISELPDAPQSERKKFTGTRSFFKSITGYSGSKADQWSRVDEDKVETTKAIAIPRTGWNVMVKGRERNAWEILAIAQAMGYDTVYGIADKHYKRLSNKLGLADFETEAKKYAEKRLTLLTKYELSRMQHSFDSYTFPAMLIHAIKNMSPVCDDLVAMSKASRIGNTIKSMFAMFDLVVPDPSDTPDYCELFRERYPLLSQIQIRHVNVADIVEYITLKEKN
jgi:hypothetical protein